MKILSKCKNQNLHSIGWYFLIFSIVMLPSLSAQNFLEKQIVQSTEAGDEYGRDFVFNTSYLVAGADQNTTDMNGGGNVPGAGAVYTYNFDEDTLLEFNQKLISPHRFNYEHFGESVGLSDSVLIVGTRYSHVDENQSNFLIEAGAAYIFSLDPPGNWNFDQKLTPKSRHEKDHFGNQVDVYEDIIAVSAIHHDYDSNNVYEKTAGSVFIFEKTISGQFKEVQHITPSDRDSADYFGGGLFLKNSKELFVGAPYQKGTNYFEGAVYYFVRNSNGVWIEQQKITPVNRILGSFGVSISAWGDYVYIGAPLEQFDLSGQNPIYEAGGAYVFKKDATGKYNQLQRILPPVREHRANFGTKVSGSEDVLVVGVPFSSTDANNQDSITFTGAVYVYIKDKNEQWQFSQKLVQTPRIRLNKLGTHVQIKENQLISSTLGMNSAIGTLTIYRRKDSSVGFTEVQNQSAYDVTLFPNPTTGNFTLKAVGLKLDRILVYDVNGRLVYKENLTGRENAEVRLPETTLNGLYLVRIVSGIEVVNKKLLVRKG